jgi:hypothetical protein
MKVSRHPFMRRLGVCLLGASPILFASGCNILGLTDDEPPPAQPITDAKAVAGMEVVGGMMEMIFSAGGEPATGETFPDYASGAYPSGMTVSVTASSDLSITLRATATNMTPPAEDGEVADDVVFNGTFNISMTYNADRTELTISMSGGFAVTGSDAPFSTMSVENAIAVLPIVNGEPGEPSGMSGTLTVDGTAYDMARIDTDGGDDSGGGSTDPADAHYFLFGYRNDGGTYRPQIVYSETTDRWDMIDLPGEGYIRAAATDGSGMIVAVGDNGMIYSSADGATWTDRSVASVTATLQEVRTSGGTWIAAGNAVILRSTNGTSWTEAWTGSPGEILHAVASDGQDNWVAAGAPPHVLVRSSNDGIAWTEEEADISNRVPEIIQRLFWTDDDTPLIALSGSPWTGASGGVYDGAELDDPPDGLDWIINGPSFGALAGAERGGVHVAVGADTSGMLVRFSSDNGDSWTDASVPDTISGDFVDMKAIGNGFLATTNMGGLLRGSADATTWQVVRDESYGSWAFAYRP